ncbi:hypothetical protein N8290_04210 [Pseudomonadales bacterium]|nr:hypothetical protein [Pseudomonadales bacterium]MDB4150891.1 hypothetical protein [Pseudomonadales bacterium]MDB9867070.1 hypothetical protein [Pseudomonadales bacterium]MDB9879765.1 hypothetical protein [Pseudomonadales bacterium]MDC1368742.1 hypothetical protein [Pseudomonadales bacterium]
MNEARPPVKKTGIFYTKAPPGVVVMWRDEVMQRYASVDELVETHVKGIAALELEMERVLEAQYRPDHD